MKIKRGDKVQVMAGDDQGKTGKVVKVVLRKRRLEVEGVNLHKRHLKSRGRQQPGGIVEVSLPIALANVMLVCPKCGQATRVRYSITGSEKHRLCGKCGELIG